MRLNFALLSNPTKDGGQVGTPGTASIYAALHCPQLLSNAGDTRGQHPVRSTPKTADKPDLSPVSPDSHSLWGHAKPSESALVPSVPAVPVEIPMNEFDHEMFEERAAIMEFDGGMSRAEAERLAMMLLGGN